MRPARPATRAGLCACVPAKLGPYGLTVDRQAPLSMGFSRQEYWSRLVFPPPGVFPTQGS